MYRIVGDLDGVDAAGAHDLSEIAEGSRRVVGGSDQADQSLVPGGFEHRQVRGPGHQVVDLHDVDPAAVPLDRAGELGPAFFRGRGPDLVGDDDLVALAVQRVGEQPLGRTVHGRGIDEPDAGPDGGIDQLVGPAVGGGSLEPPPGTEPDHRHIDPAPAQAPVLHVRHPSLGSVPSVSVPRCPLMIRDEPRVTQALDGPANETAVKPR